MPLPGIHVHRQSHRKDGHRRKRGIGPDLATGALRQGNPRAFALTLASRAAQLGGQFNDLGDACRANGVTSAEKAPTRIDRQPTAKGRRALPEQLNTLIWRRETKPLIEHDLRRRGCIMDLSHMNILGTQAGLVIGLLTRADGGDRIRAILVAETIFDARTSTFAQPSCLATLSLTTIAAAAPSAIGEHIGSVRGALMTRALRMSLSESSSLNCAHGLKEAALRLFMQTAAKSAAVAPLAAMYFLVLAA